MAGLVNVVVRFEYHYVHDMSDHCGLTYSCPYGSREKFLKQFGIKDLGHSRSIYHLAEQVIEVPSAGEITPAGFDERNVSLGGGVEIAVDEKHLPVCITESRGNNLPEAYFALWIDERNEFVCIHRVFDYMWEAGPFNQRMTGPFSVSKPLEKKIIELVKQKESGSR